MFYRGNPVAVKLLLQQRRLDGRLESCQRSNIKIFLFLLGCVLCQPYHLVSSFYHVLDKPYTMWSSLKSSSLNLSLVIWLTLINQLAHAISYLPKQGYIHRDIKADNVLISHLNNEYRAILIDFGKCVALTAVRSLAKCLHFVMSCMKQNKRHKQTLKSAQYGLGISFNRIITYHEVARRSL